MLVKPKWRTLTSLVQRGNVNLCLKRGNNYMGLLVSPIPGHALRIVVEQNGFCPRGFGWKRLQDFLDLSRDRGDELVYCA